MKDQKPTITKPPGAKPWLQQKQLRQKQTFSFGKGSVSKVGFHGTQHRG